MKSLLPLLALVALGAAVPSHRIVGGDFTNEGDFPEMVSVYSDPLLGGRKHLCGGIIVNDNHVLTTATCVDGHGTSSLYVMGAGVNLEEETGYEEHKSVNKKFVHPDYDPVNKANDLVILRLSHNFVFVSGLITPAVLPSPSSPEPSSGVYMIAVGWGQDSPNGALQERQKAVNMTYMTRDECNEVFGTFVQPNEGCLEGDDNEGICVGDEGGVVEDDLGTAVGILSWHMSCDAYPAVITLLSPYHDWIVGHFDS